MTTTITAPAPPILGPVGTANGTPQFDVPFRIGADGLVATTVQDSPEEIAAAIYNIVTCPLGAKLGDPGFGITSPLFGLIPLNLTAITKQIQALEPRAINPTVVQQALELAHRQPVGLQITAQVAAGS